MTIVVGEVIVTLVLVLVNFVGRGGLMDMTVVVVVVAMVLI